MLAEERRFRIKELLTSRRTVKATELTQMLGVTAATIRRDLAALEEEGVLVRSHGGAVSRTSSTNFQLSYEALLRANRGAKEAIAREADRLILDGETIFLEGSTTVYELARRLKDRTRLTVVTNSPPILAELHSNPGITIMSIGGDLLRDAFYLCGTWAERVLREIRVDKAILGITALDPSYGISTARHAEAQIKKQLAKSAKCRIALADHSKFGKQSFAYVGPVSDVNTIITDTLTDLAYVAALRESGIEVIIAKMQAETDSAGREKETNTIKKA